MDSAFFVATGLWLAENLTDTILKISSVTPMKHSLVDDAEAELMTVGSLTEATE